MKNIGIHEPCSEDWKGMTTNEKGAFCQKCATQVHDFTNKTNEEIKQTFRTMIGQSVCGRMSRGQEISLNAEFEAWISVQNLQSDSSRIRHALVLSLLVIFGLTLFSCAQEQDRKKIAELQTAITQVVQQQTEQIQEIFPTEAPLNLTETVSEVPGYEDIIVGAYERQIDFVGEITPVGVIQQEMIDYGTLGGVMVSTSMYEQYLMETTPITVTEELDANGNIIPRSFDAKVFPNPAGERTTFEMAVPAKGNFDIYLYDMSGKLIEGLFRGEIERGTYRQEVDLSKLTPGTYLVIVNSEQFKNTIRISKI